MEQISRTLLPYDNKNNRFFFKKDGRKIKLEDAETQILSAYQPTNHQKFCFFQEKFKFSKTKNCMSNYKKFVSLQDMEFTVAKLQVLSMEKSLETKMLL